MVTNRKPSNDIPSPTPRATTHEGVPEYSFAEVAALRRDREHVERLRLERLMRWNALGLAHEASGGFHLEAALELVRSMHDEVRHSYLHYSHAGHAPVPVDEAEQIATRFAEDCDALIAAGAQVALWHLLVDDRHVCFETVGDVVIEKLEAGDVDELARLLDASRCFALAAIATMPRAEDRSDARLLFLGEKHDDATLVRFAPFAVDNRVDDREERIHDAAFGFACATVTSDRIEALENLAVGLSERERRGGLSPGQRRGLVAWCARCVLRSGAEVNE